MSSKVTLPQLREEPYCFVICYPEPKITEVEKRIRELEDLRITTLEFVGEKLVANLHVLGKGCVGIVVKAHGDCGEVAVKIRRVDADRASMQHEAKMLAAANKVDVGPRLLGASENFLIMQFIDGQLLPKWLDNRSEDKLRLRQVLRKLLEQCWRLDDAGLDHGELSHAPKHIIIDSMDDPFILDFEAASIARKASNVTSLTQFLFIDGPIADKISRILGRRDTQALLDAVKKYKFAKSRENFDAVMSVCGI